MVVIKEDSAFFRNYEQKIARKYPALMAVSPLFKKTVPGNYTHRVVWGEALMDIIAIELTFSSEAEETVWCLRWL